MAMQMDMLVEKEKVKPVLEEFTFSLNNFIIEIKCDENSKDNQATRCRGHFTTLHVIFYSIISVIKYQDILYIILSGEDFFMVSYAQKQIPQ